MINNADYRQITSVEAVTSHGTVGVKILIYHSNPIGTIDHENNPELYNQVFEARERIKDEIIAAMMEHDPCHAGLVSNERDRLMNCFSGKIFVKPIPNGYSSEIYTRAFPWFEVTTAIGKFVIGWRRQVINIDWSGTVCTKKAENIFPQENVTKGDHSIHAHSLPDAKRYIATIMLAAPKPYAEEA